MWQRHREDTRRRKYQWLSAARGAEEGSHRGSCEHPGGDGGAKRPRKWTGAKKSDAFQRLELRQVIKHSGKPSRPW